MLNFFEIYTNVDVNKFVFTKFRRIFTEAINFYSRIIENVKKNV